MIILRFTVVVLLLAAIACNSDRELSEHRNGSLPEQVNSTSLVEIVTPTPRPFDSNLDIGVVIPGSKCSELFIRNEELRPGDEIQVVSVEEKPHKKLKATVVGSNNCKRSPKSELGEIVVNSVDPPPDQYEIRFEDPAETTFGFGVVTDSSKLRIIKGTAQLIVSDNSNPLFFRDCTGNESYHMTVWKGKPLVGKRIWHSYISLRYDTVPTCKPADYR